MTNDRSTGSRILRSIVASAAAIAGITMAARVVGFVRSYIFSQTVGDSCLGDVYNTMNLLPTVLFEVAAGGALASVIVPILRPLLDAQDRDRASQVFSALTWRMVPLLAFLGLIMAWAARPLATFLLQGELTEQCPGAIDEAVALTWWFAPQLPLYGVAVLWAAALQAEQRFVRAALAPLISSFVVALAYIVFAIVTEPVMSSQLEAITLPAQAILAGGTTAGVLAMALTVGVRTSSGVRLRASWSWDADIAAHVRRLMLSGMAAVAAQQITMLGMLKLANLHGGASAATQWSYIWMLFMLPYAVLALPLVTSAFPSLVSAAQTGPEQLRSMMSGTARTVVLASAVGTVVTATAAPAVSMLYTRGPRGSGLDQAMTWGLMYLSVALVAMGILAVTTRVLYAVGAAKSAMVGPVVGWLAGLVVAAVSASGVSTEQVLPSQGISLAVGLWIGAAISLIATGRLLGWDVFAGWFRTAIATLLLIGFVSPVGWLLGRVLMQWISAQVPAGPEGTLRLVTVLGISSALALALAILVAMTVDPRGSRPLVGSLRRLGRSNASTRVPEADETSATNERPSKESA